MKTNRRTILGMIAGLFSGINPLNAKEQTAEEWLQKTLTTRWTHDWNTGNTPTPARMYDANGKEVRDAVLRCNIHTGRYQIHKLDSSGNFITINNDLVIEDKYGLAPLKVIHDDMGELKDG